MKCIRKYIYLLFIGHLINSPIAQGAADILTLPSCKTLADTAPPLPAEHDTQSFEFDYEYKVGFIPQYSDVVNVDNTSIDALAIHLFNTYFFRLRDPTPLPTASNSVHFLSSLKAAHQDIQNFIYQPANLTLGKYLEKIFQDTLKIIADRYGLAKIEDMVINKNGFLGRDVLKNIPDGPTENKLVFKSTIEALTGRIFVVKNEGGAEKIISFSSGMIIPRTESGITKYDQIITCCHSMASDELSPNLEFYFVRSQHLDPTTGLPNSTTIGHAAGITPPTGQTYDQIINSQQFIAYLRQESKGIGSRDNHVRRIIKFKNLCGNNLEPEHHIPRYNPDTDCGYGYLNRGFRFIDTVNHIPNFATINILKNLPVQTLAYDYYALGYPGFPYYSTVASSLLAQELRLAPFTMTKSQSNVPDSVNPGHFILTPVNNGTLRHGATSMKGMSGGPVLVFDQAHSKINILGIVSSGYMDGNYACKPW